MTAPRRVPDAVEEALRTAIAKVSGMHVLTSDARAVLSALTVAGLTLREEGEVERENARLRAEIEKARVFAAMFVAFHGRDHGSLRWEERTLPDLVQGAIAVSDFARAALGGKNEDH